MSASIDTPTPAQIDRLTNELEAHRHDLKAHRQELRHELTELQRSVRGLPTALELERTKRRTRSWEEFLSSAGYAAITGLAAFVAAAALVAILR